jgi:hypothetical protein
MKRCIEKFRPTWPEDNQRRRGEKAVFARQPEAPTKCGIARIVKLAASRKAPNSSYPSTTATSKLDTQRTVLHFEDFTLR